ncbi:hypothetical protein Nepgr_000727 [Nepenthes gracilis]|uniref:Protein kinase domain-containing protein n=1 Tax=Nepenthes gracilis TaxID=150966 RepID=A0AAD3P3W8_NEPGR|nr:hypothetical protein Nepgr_000727 [Nepenthes gracilis]
MHTHSCLYSLLFSLFSLVLISSPSMAKAGDAESLLALRTSVDPERLLQWRIGSDVCTWQGVRECLRGRVAKLVLEHLNLTGTLDEKSLNRLDQLRVLSFKGNKMSGDIPNLSGLRNLKSLYLNDNSFGGSFPSSVIGLHRLKVIVLSDNRISGSIPSALVKVSRLHLLYLDNNDFTGEIPPLNQTSLRFFNVSNNRLFGEIPPTPALFRFNESSFLNNINLCGPQIHTLCNKTPVMSPEFSPSSYPRHNKVSKRSKIIAGGASGVLILILIVMLVVGLLYKKRRHGRKKVMEGASEKKGEELGVGRVVRERGEGSGYGGGDGGNSGGKGFSWEGEGIGSLVFIGAGDQQMSYSLEDLLKASAETLGRGTVGSTYKAVMESGYIVTVKRLKDARYPRMEEFRRQMELLGRLRHPNIVPVRAYFQAKEERLLVYDYFPNGSLFSLIHGSRPSGSGKPLHWTSCLKIAEDLASGLLYIHQNCGLLHGNLKSCNVLLGSDFESCLTDYGLHSFRNPDSTEEPSAASLFYKAPECRDTRKPPTQQADVYSFGVLLLELLTGKTPFQDLVQEHGSDIPKWVKSVREEETESGDDPSSGNETSEEKLGALLNIAMACVAVAGENRPLMREVLKMIRDTRAEAQVSSNSSDHSPGRWSDTVQGFPREEHLSI